MRTSRLPHSIPTTRFCQELGPQAQTLSFEHAFRVDAQPVSVEMVEVLSRAMETSGRC